MRKKVSLQVLGELFQVIVQWRKGSEKGRAAKVVDSVEAIGEFVRETLAAAAAS